MCRRLRRLADEKCASGWKWNRLLCDANRARFSTSDRWFRESDTVAQLLVAAVGRRRHRKRLGSNPFHARPRQTARGVGPARPVPGLPVLYPSHPPPPPPPILSARHADRCASAYLVQPAVRPSTEPGASRTWRQGAFSCHYTCTHSQCCHLADKNQETSIDQLETEQGLYGKAD